MSQLTQYLLRQLELTLTVRHRLASCLTFGDAEEFNN